MRRKQKDNVLERMKILKIGFKFLNIINENVLNEISDAMNSLHTDLLYTDKETAEEIIHELVKESKRVVNCYIDEQKTTLLKLIDVFESSH